MPKTTLDTETIRSAKTGVILYCAVAVLGMVALAFSARAFGDRLTTAELMAVTLAGMWMPSLARMVATRTVDRGYRAPLPVRDGRRPRMGVSVAPLLVVLSIYGAAYGVAILLDVDRSVPSWSGARQVALNVAVNGVLVSIPGFVGALGEEWGWRGYLQPRLDQLEVPGSPWVVAAVSLAYHAPFILALGYIETGSPLVSLGLFALLELGLAPTWTWLTYRFRSMWAAVWVHTWHNTLSQTLFPKALGAGSDIWLGESGILPSAGYAVAAILCVLAARRSAGSFATYLQRVASPSR